MRQILRVLQARVWLLLAVTVITILAAITADILLPTKYVASVLLSPQSDSLSSNQLGSLGATLSQYGTLASLAGFSVPTDTRRAEAEAMLQSRILTEEYIKENDLLPVLFANEWDAGTKRWKVSSPARVPTLWQGNRKFERIRSVSTDPRTGLVTLTIKWTDPVIAARWANGIVKLTNDYLRREAIARSERDVAYLNDEAQKTNIVETRQAIALLLQSELNKAMLAKGSEEYAFKVLDPAVPPQKPSSMKLILVAVGAVCVILATLLGILFTANKAAE